MKALLALGGVLIALGVSLGAPALSNYAEQRSAWREVSGEVEAGGYDAALSDALYRTSEETRLDGEWAGACFALGCLLLAAGWTPKHGVAVPPRPWRVTLVDGALAWGVWALAGSGEAAQLWDTRESALAAAIASAAPVLFFLPYAGLVAGRSPGLSVVGGGLPESRVARLRALLLAPLSFPLLLVTFWAPGRFSRLKAIHLPIAGEVGGTSRSEVI